MESLVDATGTVFYVHPRRRCRGRPCPFHNPSPGPLEGLPIIIRESGLVERLCRHGVGHPDGDSLRHLDPDGRLALGVHGCCGVCCRRDGKTSSTAL